MEATGRPTALPHISALDGVRGAAVAGVLLFHGGHLLGGYLGVDLFFTLSGFLITSLLLAESSCTGHIGLGGFWARRARRLLPALAVLMVGIALYCRLVAPSEQLAAIRGDAFATLGYFANWHEIFSHQNYFALFTAPSPLNHTWSLAIEEQFYVIWPLVLVALITRFKRATPKAVLTLSLVLATASSISMIALYSPTNVPRLYYGTDTRAAAILFGAALAAWVSVHGPVQRRSLRLALDVLGLVGALVLAVAWTRLDGQSSTLYRGGFIVCGLAATAVIAATVQPGPGMLSRALSWRPLCALGLISYGVYLYHWPIDLVVDEKRTGFGGWPLFACQTAVTLIVATVSYRVIEQPVRHGALSGYQWRKAIPAIATGLAVLLFVATIAPSPSVATNGAAGLNGVGGLGALDGPVTHPISTAALAFRTAPSGSRRVMIVGDSVAYFLGPALQGLHVDPPLSVLNAAVQACSFFPGVERVQYRSANGSLILWPTFPCDPSWEAGAVKAFHPDVVIWVVTHPPVAYLSHGRWYKVCQAPFQARYQSGLRAEIKDLKATGAHVAITTEVYDRSVGDGSDSATDCDNRLRRKVAAETHTQIIDLLSFVCPQGHCRETADGVVLREDGTHYKGAGASIVARWLIDQVKG